jgi:ADP-ribose pyrophosphatase
MKPEKIIQADTLFTGKLITLEQRQARLEDGTIVGREIVRTRGAVVIVPLTANHEVRLIKQYRAAAETWLIELPAGTLDPGEAPDQAAPRELLEETGDQAATWQSLGGFYTAPGILTEYLHLYLATNLTPGPNRLEIDEHIQVLTVPWSDVIAMLKRDEIEDVKTIAGLMRAGLYLQLPLI